MDSLVYSSKGYHFSIVAKPYTQDRIDCERLRYLTQKFIILLSSGNHRLNGIPMFKLFSLVWVAMALLGSITFSEPLKITYMEGTVNNQINKWIMEEVYRRAEVEVDFIVVPPKRASLMSKSGASDGEVSRIERYGANRPYLTMISTPIGSLDTTVFIRNDVNPRGIFFENLKTTRVGVIRGIKHAENAVKNHENVINFSSISELIRALDIGRVDAIVHSSSAVNFELFRRKKNDVVPITPPVRIQSVHHFLRSEYVHEVERIEAALQKLVETGELSKIRSKAIQRFYETYAK